MEDTKLPSIPGVYLITNTVSCSRYVGSAVNMCKRQSNHLNDLSYGTHHNRHLQSAYNLYGKDAFVFSILEHVPNLHDLTSIEQRYIDTLVPEYNLSPIAGSPLGVKHSSETRAKVSAAMMGRPVSEETRALHRAMKLGIPHSELRRTNIREAMAREETRGKMSLANKGKSNPKAREPKSEETRAKMSEAMRKRWESRTDRIVSEETRMKRSFALKGRKQSEETCAKKSAALKGKTYKKRSTKPIIVPPS